VIVVDASALVDFLTPLRIDPSLDERIASSIEIHAPHLIDVEVAHALQRLTARAEIAADRAADALLDLSALPIRRYPHPPLLDRAWELRQTVSAYDAMYVALAELLDVTLVTCDAALARAPGVRARVEVYAPD
jgi:predicted nucleic acid-binding protein